MDNYTILFVTHLVLYWVIGFFYTVPRVYNSKQEK